MFDLGIEAIENACATGLDRAKINGHCLLVVTLSNHAGTRRFSVMLPSSGFTDYLFITHDVFIISNSRRPHSAQTMESWVSISEKEMFAVAGLWRPTDEWGDCYTMVMTKAEGEAATIHNQMSFILDSSTQNQWLYARIDDAMELCRPLNRHTGN